MKKINLKYLYKRTCQLLLHPQEVWPSVLQEDFPAKDIYRNYLIPVAALTSVVVLVVNLLRYSFFQASGMAVINLLSASFGTWFAYLITREYLCGKLNYTNNFALNLTIYSAAIFIIFHGIGSALGNLFLGQVFTLLSFIFIRTLYTGLGLLPHIQASQKTNILIITSLTIICLPVIITQILRIVFGISAFNV